MYCNTSALQVPGNISSLLGHQADPGDQQADPGGQQADPQGTNKLT
jgi:hypothetical protein